MYLTQMSLNPSRRGTRELVASAHRLHAAVLSGFPPQAALANDEGRILWRLDRDEPHRIDLWVSSPAPPDFTGICERAGWPTLSDPWRTASLDPFLGRLTRGQHWRFRLTANPVVSRSQPGRTASRRLPHVTGDQQQQWLTQRAERLGFAVSADSHDNPNILVRERKDLRFPHTDAHSAHKVTIRAVTFEGVLEVLDPLALRSALSHGIGRGKAFGCGLMTLAPL